MNGQEEDDNMYGLSHGGTLEFLPDDVMLPVQFFEGLRRHAHEDDGCRKLIYAIFEDALRTYLHRRRVITNGHGGSSAARRERYFQDAKAWLFEEHDGPFSCAWICDHLGIEVTALRKALRALSGESVVIPRRSPMGNHGGVLGLPRARTKRSRWSKAAVELTNDGN